MLYYLSNYADALPGVNVFRYVSFRTAWATLTALLVAYLVFPPFVRWMKAREVAQIIRDDGPASHLLTKVGTPTMGGLCILAAVTLSVLLWARIDVPGVWMALAVMLGYGAIGLYDDWQKVAHQSSAGLSGRYKLLLQTLVAVGVLGYGHVSGLVSPRLTLPFVHTAIDFAELYAGAPAWLGWLYPLFGVVVLVGSSNAVNLTDGLDGLAIGPVMTCAATYGVLAYVAGHAQFADYLGIEAVAGASELTVVAMALIGAGLGFLWYNAYPAQVFMGDVGSLALGGLLGLLAVVTKHEILLVLVGGIFVLEALSVIIQVLSFKSTGKRVFLMAPIHHHYEKLGWSEPKIIVRFWIISVVLALVGLSTLKLR